MGIGINIFTLTVLKLKKKSISWKRMIALKIMECSFRIDLNPFLWRWKVIQAFFAGTKSHQLWWQLLRWGRPLGAKNYGWRKTLHHSTWKAQCSVAFFYQNWTFRSDNFKRIFWFLQFFQEKNKKIQPNSTLLCTVELILLVLWKNLWYRKVLLKLTDLYFYVIETDHQNLQLG